MEGFEEFFIKWFLGPLKNEVYQYREVARTVGAYRLEKPKFERNYVTDFIMGLTYVKEHFRKENLFLSIAFYSKTEISDPRFQWLFYDFDSENPQLAIEKALEFHNSLRKRFGIEAVLVKSGFKGLHVIIPLKRLIDFDSYRYLWSYLIQPYNFSLVLDQQVCEPRRLQRVPYTFNIKLINGVPHRRLARVIDIRGKPIKANDFDWSNYEPLNPDQVPLIKVRFNLPEIKVVRISNKGKTPLPENIESLAINDCVPPCIRSIIETMVRVGDVDHSRRLALLWYLMWVGFSQERIIGFFKRYAKDFKERITQYQVNYAFRKQYIMYSCRKMKELGICLGCGWDRNPVTYTYRRAYVDPEIMKRFFSLVKGVSK